MYAPAVSSLAPLIPYPLSLIPQKFFSKNYLQNKTIGFIIQSSNSYWWMKHVGESLMAYRRSNTLRYLLGDRYRMRTHSGESL